MWLLRHTAARRHGELLGPGNVAVPAATRHRPRCQTPRTAERTPPSSAHPRLPRAVLSHLSTPNPALPNSSLPPSWGTRGHGDPAGEEGARLS